MAMRLPASRLSRLEESSKRNIILSIPRRSSIQFGKRVLKTTKDGANEILEPFSDQQQPVAETGAGRQSGMVWLIVFATDIIRPRPPPASTGFFQYATRPGRLHHRQIPQTVCRGRTPGGNNSKIIAAFQQLFHGDPATQAVYYTAGANSNGPLAYVTDIKHHDVRTEGLSYGMMIAVQMNQRAEFDAIWNWSKTYLYHDSPGHPSYGFFSWQARTNGTVMSEFVAPDGESYYVMALYFAANRWGSGAGIYNYQSEADRLLTNHAASRADQGPDFLRRSMGPTVSPR